MEVAGMNSSASIELHHVSILTDDVPGSISFYRDLLGMQLAGRFFQEGVMDIAFLRDGPGSTPFAIHLNAPPFPDWIEEIYGRQGPGLDHVAFVVDDLESWHTRLEGFGIEVLEAPSAFLGFHHFYFRDPAGMAVELQERSAQTILPCTRGRDQGAGGIAYLMNHVSMLCNALGELERFYIDALGMQTVFDWHDEGFVLVADPAFVTDRSRSAVTLEIMGSEAEWEREQTFLRDHGPGIDHLCFVVADVDAAYQTLRSRDVPFNYPPEDMDTNRVAFFKDPNQVDVELMMAIPRAHFLK
jgi:catechol 2,3-dioxygenase-like lactoylglutathione lyase family enzyme